MAIVLPKDHRFLIGFRFPELIPFDLSDLPLNTILSPVFRLAVLEGSESGRGKTEDIGDIEKSVTNLVGVSRLQNFSSTVGLRMADRVVRSSLIRTVRDTRSGKTQISGLLPYTVACFKVAFPTTKAGFRQVDRLLYSMLLTEWNEDKRSVRMFIEQTFGAGVQIRGIPEPEATRAPGEHDSLDVLTELSLAYVEKFPAVVPKRAPREYVPAKPLPSFQRLFGRDLRRFWTTYSTREPSSLLTDQTITLIAFELTVLTVKLIHAIPFLESSRELPVAMQDTLEPSPPELYLDWIGDPRQLSRTIATASVRRDVSQMSNFTRAVIRLRYLNEMVKGLRVDREARALMARHLIDDPDVNTVKYIQQLLLLAEDHEFGTHLRFESRRHLRAIVDANLPNHDEDEDQGTLESEVELRIRDLSESGLDTIEQVQELLFAVQGAKTLTNNLTWFRSVGGVGATYGLISGMSNRRTWSYSPGNELLTVLVQLCAVDYEGWNPAKGAEPRGFGLADFLDWLERRFGIIVDRPPVDLGFDGPEHVAAARDNLQAMLRRLRQMGMFEDQSDDFSVQHITPPFADAG